MSEYQEMSQSNNILQELKDLDIRLFGSGGKNVYVVPEGYFDSLADVVLNRIREEAAAEMALKGFSREMPFGVPAGYFENLPDQMVLAVNKQADNAKTELEELSPLLSGLKKEMPNHVPAGYFNNITGLAKPAKIVKLSSRKWFRYAAAAMMTGVVLLAGLLLFRQQDPEKTLAKFEQNLTREISNTSDADLNEFIQNTSVSQDLAVVDAKDEVKALLKEFPAEELQHFLDEIGDPDLEVSEFSIME